MSNVDYKLSGDKIFQLSISVLSVVSITSDYPDHLNCLFSLLAYVFDTSK